MFTNDINLDGLGIQIKAATMEASSGIISPEDVDTIVEKNRVDDNERISALTALELAHEFISITDLEHAAIHIRKCMDENKHIALVTDYDSDGVCSATVLTRCFTDVFGYSNTTTIVNHRRDGNGFNNILVERILELNRKKSVDLVITADHGSVDNVAYTLLKKNNIDVIVTDHHTVPEVTEVSYPSSAVAFINTHRSDCGVNTNLSGCTTAFALMYVLGGELNPNNKLSDYFDVLPFVGLSIITDQMSLKDPANRFLVDVALKIINSGLSRTFTAMSTVLGVSMPWSSTTLGFSIGPVINTANRVGNEELAFNMMTVSDDTKRERLLMELNAFNTRRKNAQQFTIRQLLGRKSGYLGKHSIVSVVKTPYSIGRAIVSNLASRHNLPGVIFTDNDTPDVITGSGLAVLSDINLVELFNEIENEDGSIFVKKGGHPAAAGCSIYRNKYLDFKRLFDKKCGEFITDDIRHKTEFVDFFAIEDDNLYDELSAYAVADKSIYGNKWKNVTIAASLMIRSVIVESTYAKIVFSINGNIVNGICFLKDDTTVEILTVLRTKPNTAALVIFTPEINRYGGRTSLSLQVEKIKKI